MAEIVRLESVDEKTCSEINELLHQFNDVATSVDLLRTMIGSLSSELWTAVEDRIIVGMATLVLVVKVGGTSSRIEDVVVHEQYRKRGIGKALCQKLIERARAHGAYSIHLTSRPDRVIANELYKKLGFKLHNTNAYRMQL
ncbi:GNAT family N-acetyltransferase [Candidatus Kaiserbacteria bacterium]|nr:GNAT family N-acetyltransferase [Candidatus Kaiserbacteria bacterium]